MLFYLWDSGTSSLASGVCSLNEITQELLKSPPVGGGVDKNLLTIQAEQINNMPQQPLGSVFVCHLYPSTLSF